LEYSPQADCLFISDGLTQENGMFMRSEVHLLAYMSCLLHLYAGGSIADWGYTFYGTIDGAPFSDELELSFQSLIESRLISPSGEGFMAIEGLGRIASAYSLMETLRVRHKCISASIATIQYFGSGVVREALEQEPVLSKARKAGTERRLFAEGGLDSLYFHFQFIRDRLGNHDDLRFPGILWVGSLYEIKLLGASE